VYVNVDVVKILTDAFYHRFAVELELRIVLLMSDFSYEVHLNFATIKNTLDLVAYKTGVKKFSYQFA